jgi:hypothetical protein
MWNILKEATFGNNSKNQQINEINVNESVIKDPADMANTFNAHFSSIGQKISNEIPTFRGNPEDLVPNYPPNKPYLEFEEIGPVWITDIVKTLPSKMSPDLDGLSLKFVKRIIFSISTPLAHIFTLSLNSGVFPSKFKESRIVPIFKQGDPKNVDNYRPIALVNTLSKILEKIVSIKLTNHLQINKLLYKNQYGFLRGLSTEMNLLNVINFVSSALNDNNYCIGVFLDLKKAFDVCSHDILLKKLAKFGIRGRELDWFKSYLKNRKQKTEIAGILSDESMINISVLQGTTLGPILFLCYINDIFHCTNLSLFLFADDTSCLIKGDNINNLINTLNGELQKITNWLTINKMALNINKTKYIIFRARGKKLDNIPNVILNMNEIGAEHDQQKCFIMQRVSNDEQTYENKFYKLLGVYLDEYLTFDFHTKFLISKLSRSIYCIKRAVNKLSKKALKLLYNSMFHSHLLYCSIITSCTSQSNINKIFKMQKKIIRIINKAPYRARTKPLFIESEVMPYDKVILYNKLMFMHSIFYGYAPEPMLNLFTKNNMENRFYEFRNIPDFNVPFARIEIVSRMPSYSLPALWNRSGVVTYHSNRTTFMYALKEEIFSNITDDN